MESVADTLWDVVICGTGLQQSLLALALSRSGKNILHIDPNPYYGGPDAALSLDEADAWAARHAEGPAAASAARLAPAAGPGAAAAAAAAAGSSSPSLGPPSAYAIALAPAFLHARSALVGQLVSSRAFRQLEFLAVSSFYVVDGGDGGGGGGPHLARVPATREDVFADTSLPARAKRQLMKFLKFVLACGGGGGGGPAGYDAASDAAADPAVDALWRPHAAAPLGGFVQSVFGLDDRVRDLVLALTLSLDGAGVTVADGLARLHRHVTSMGVFGAGFAAVYPKWGGCGEIVQVACRAAAVGGAVYMLGTGLRGVRVLRDGGGGGDGPSSPPPRVEVELARDGLRVQTRLLVTGSEAEMEMPAGAAAEADADAGANTAQRLSRLVAVVGDPLPFLFAPTVEGAPVAGGAVIALPAGRPVLADGTAPAHPIFVMAHSSDTGECPPGQSVLYFTTLRTDDSRAVLGQALAALLGAFAAERGGDDGGSAAPVAPIACLYQMYYEQPRGGSSSSSSSTTDEPAAVFRFPPLPVDLAVQDAPLDGVREAWRRVLGPEAADEAAYMAFADREGIEEEEEGGETALS